MIPTLFVAAFLLQQEDPIKMGDRVEITLKSGFAVRGRLVQTTIGDDGRAAFTADPNVDLAKLTILLLDLSWDHPELSGEMGVERVNIQSMRKLRQLTPAEARELEKRRQEALARAQKEDDARRAAAAREDKARLDELEALAKAKREKDLDRDVGERKAKADSLARGRAAYEKFPPPQWSADTLKEIEQKRRLRLPVSEEMQEFERTYADRALYESELDKRRK